MPWRIVATAAILVVTSVAQAADTTADEVSKRVIEARAVEAVIWGMPAVNYDLMLQEFKRTGGKENQIVYWSRPLDGNNQTLTPNPELDLLHGLLQYEGRPRRPRNPARRRRRIDQRQHCHHLADAVG